MDAYFFNFSKRLNETKQPTLTDGVKIEVLLKDGVSLDNPTFRLQYNFAGFTFNYMYFNGEYFFINDNIQVSNYVMEIVCEKDPMATYKTQIGAVICMIEYAASGMNDNRSYLNDPRASMTGSPTTSLAATVSSPCNAKGSYVLTFISSSTPAIGFASGAILDAASVDSIRHDLFADDVVAELKKYFANPADAVVEAHWVPFEMPTGASDMLVYFGNQKMTTSGRCYDLDTHKITAGGGNISIPWNYDTNCKYMTKAPFSTMELALPMYGTITIDPSELQDGTGLASTIYVVWKCDYVSGELLYVLNADKGTFFKTISCQCAVPLPVGQITTNTVQGMQQIAAGTIATGAGIAGIASGGGLAVGAGAIVGGLGAIARGMMETNIHTPSSIGNYGSFAKASMIGTAAWSIVLRMKTWKNSITQGAPASFYTSSGYPLFSGGRISDYSGYIKCANASVSIPGSNTDRSKINAYMNAGFYYN